LEEFLWAAFNCRAELNYVASCSNLRLPPKPWLKIYPIKRKDKLLSWKKFIIYFLTCVALLKIPGWLTSDHLQT